MPIPFLLAGLGLAAVGIGMLSHNDAKETNEKAERIAEAAKHTYDLAKKDFNSAKLLSENSLVKYGNTKKKVWDTSMQRFLGSYEKIKNIEFTNVAAANDLSCLPMTPKDVAEVREMIDLYSSLGMSGAAGAATGALVALAASGSLATVTGGLSLAGSALLAGEVGAAAGIAGSALSLGAAVTPLAAIAAPVVLFTGISASMKADKNLSKARAMEAEADAAAEKMKLSSSICKDIAQHTDLYNKLLLDLNNMFDGCSYLLNDIVDKKESRFPGEKLVQRMFTDHEIAIMAVCGALAKAVKAVIYVPLVEGGIVNSYSREVLSQQRKECTKVANQIADLADRIYESSKGTYNRAVQGLISAKNSAEENLVQYGNNVKTVLDEALPGFMKSYKKISHIQLNASGAYIHSEYFTEQDVNSFKSLKEVYYLFNKTKQADAATNNLAMIATKGKLASDLNKKDIRNGLVNPIASIEIPAVNFDLLILDSGSQDKLISAQAIESQVDESSQTMNNSVEFCNSVMHRVSEHNNLLGYLNNMFKECSPICKRIISRREGGLFKKKLKRESFSEAELQLISVYCSLAKLMKTMIDEPVLSSSGELNPMLENTYVEVYENATTISNKLAELKQIDFSTEKAIDPSTESAGVIGKVIGAAVAIAIISGIINVVLR